MARIHAAVLAGAWAVLIPARAGAADGFHPFRDFGKDTAAPPGQSASSGGTTATTVVSGSGVLSVTTVSSGDPGSAIGRADPHPYHPFRDFGKEAAAPPKPAASIPADDNSVSASPRAAEDEKEPWSDVKAFDQKDADEQREDAAANFETVVRSFLAQEATPEGCWSYREKGKKMCLALVAVDGAHAKKAGKGRYSAVAAMKDVHGKARPALRFTVDFSGPSWEVVDIERLTK